MPGFSRLPATLSRARKIPRTASPGTLTKRAIMPRAHVKEPAESGPHAPRINPLMPVDARPGEFANICALGRALASHFPLGLREIYDPARPPFVPGSPSGRANKRPNPRSHRRDQSAPIRGRARRPRIMRAALRRARFLRPATHCLVIEAEIATVDTIRGIPFKRRKSPSVGFRFPLFAR